MSDTVLEHFLVRDYLRELSAVCVTLPAAQARELREQIIAHLDEALPPEATDAEVQAELARLGRPRSLAAEAAGPGWQPVGRRLRNWLGHVRWWVWAALAVLVSALGTGAGFLISMSTTAVLNVPGEGWLYPEAGVAPRADAVTEFTVPIRSGQRQGLQLLVENDSDWTQVVLGADLQEIARGFRDFQVTVETGPHLNSSGNPGFGGSHFTAPGAIPPHSDREVRVTWISHICVAKGGTTSFDYLPLRVRVGVITRTEDVKLDPDFALAGPSQGRCG
jgi:hypothetical protein